MIRITSYNVCYTKLLREAHPEAIEDKYKVVLPVTTKDLRMHGMYVVFTRFIGGNDLGRVQQWSYNFV